VLLIHPTCGRAISCFLSRSPQKDCQDSLRDIDISLCEPSHVPVAAQVVPEASPHEQKLGLESCAPRCISELSLEQKEGSSGERTVASIAVSQRCDSNNQDVSSRIVHLGQGRNNLGATGTEGEASEIRAESRRKKNPGPGPIRRLNLPHNGDLPALAVDDNNRDNNDDDDEEEEVSQRSSRSNPNRRRQRNDSPSVAQGSIGQQEEEDDDMRPPPRKRCKAVPRTPWY